MSNSVHHSADSKSGVVVSSTLSSHSPTQPADPVSPMSHSPRSEQQGRTAELSASESDTEASMASSSSPKSMPLKRGAWSPQEDEKLVQLVETMQPLKWVHVAQEMRSRTSKQCRERYHNYLKPSLTRAPITKEEGRKIEELVAIHGKRWAEISRQLPGRSDNAIKNWWNAGINRRRASQDQSPSGNMMMIKQQSPARQLNITPPNSRSDMIAEPHSKHTISAGAPPAGVPPPVQPQLPTEDGTHSPSVHVPPPVQVMFSSMYAEPSSRMHTPVYAHGSAPPNASVNADPAHAHTPQPSHIFTQPQLQQPSQLQPSQAPQQQPPLPGSLPRQHGSQVGAQHTYRSQSSVSPYPLTASQRAESRADSQARLSVASLSSMCSRSNSVVEDLRSVSPSGSSPPLPARQPYGLSSASASSGYLHTSDDPSAFFSRLRQNSDFRKNSVDSTRTDATSLSHYSLGNSGGSNTLPNSRRPSLQPPIPAEMASPQDQQPQTRQSRLSIANLMNH